jgi:hypothetical protein
MRRYLSKLIFCILLIATPLSAEIVQVDLPEFTGFYSPDSINTRSAHFLMPKIPTDVQNVSIVFSSNADTGLLNCEGAYRGIGPWQTSYHFTMLDSSTGHSWNTYFIYEDSSSALDTTKTFSTHSGASWEFLKNGFGDITIEWYPLPYVLTYFEVRRPSVILYDVHLIVEGDFILPNKEKTWGVIKAIYSSIE